MSELRDILNDENKIQLISKAAFNVVDTDRSGYIDFEELEHLMQDMAQQLSITAPTTKEIFNAFKEID